jgi:hypothetical protein
LLHERPHLKVCSNQVHQEFDMKSWKGAASVAATAMAVIGPQAIAGQTGSPRIVVTPQTSQTVMTGAADRFTGSAKIQSLFDAKGDTRSTGGQVTFQPGARSAWHTHPLGQVLIVTDGTG